MDLKQAFFELIASLFIVFKRIFLLLFYPYKTMRSIAKETDYTQIVIISTTVVIYYVAVEKVKDLRFDPILQMVMVLFNFAVTVAVPILFNYIHHRKIEWRSSLFLFTYALIPTIIWFYLNTLLFVTLPPPRQLTILGKIFSIVFITLSVSLLAWKVILWYLAARFSTKLQFYDILYILIVYLAIILPYSILLYRFGFFRIPFL